ncbi:Uma2 family endonuclease [Roseiflexus sp.]|uniref:Uma2 family endonuclease n=1 Tax=Roseiflexus sp. TaxID=2562120 RepID=UPI00398AF26A
MTAATAVQPMCIGLVHEITNIDLAARQGTCSVEPYLALTTQTNRLIAYAGGVRAFLPMPTDTRQAMLEVRFLARWGDVERYGGNVRFAPLRLLVREGTFREPDLFLAQGAHDPRRQNDDRRSADLTSDIVRPDNPVRDLEERLRDDAEAGFLSIGSSTRSTTRSRYKPWRGGIHRVWHLPSRRRGALAPARQLCRVCR